ncbi:FluC/FEX family fluoride channel [Lysinibacter cavernae]|uniref:Fluoride-specific ion channel FluC n=1 Tax=Lysinibacter cavernae TaxID=1640652 RepID=A0A7X5R1I5_9MICO|nr:CrcB family protein [Lysinibacter cavernae]NIH53717.1 CrcB protein [Lysinibacter cavernae]
MSRISAAVWGAVFAGGVLGAGLRLLIHELIGSGAAVDPWPTLIVNLFGCLLLAFVAAFWQERVVRDWLKAGIRAGFIGTFTTFSALMIELFVSLYNGNVLWAIGLLVVSIGGGWVCSAWGYELGQMAAPRRQRVQS